ncbi:nitroreductase family protein [Variovorax atrisoli]|uniref:nitroreductase family protein n=1 Tax=Variovorax atrisoli TaxID=3394203 RepID=UPI0040403C39
MLSQTRQPGHPIHPLFTDRWSPRAYTGEAISTPELLTVLEAARWAPSAYNAQPWRFIYAQRDTAAWQPIFDALVEFNRGWAQRAAALVVVVSAKDATFPGQTEAAPNPWHAFDAGAAWASLAFQATLSGWSAHGMAGFDADALRAAVNLPQSYAIQTVVAIGRRADKGVLPEALQAREVPNDRRPLAQSAAEGHFSFGS